MGGHGSVCTAAILTRPCPLWVRSGHWSTSAQCLLYPQKRTSELNRGMSALCQKQTHAVQHTTDKWSPRRCVGIVLFLDPPHAVRQSALGKHFYQAPRRRYGTLSRPLTLPFWHPCHGDDVMDRNNLVGRRERFEILKIVQRLGEGVVAVDKGPLRPLRPNAILGALEESIALRNREGRMWPALFLDWASGRRSAAKRSPKMRHDGSRRT